MKWFQKVLLVATSAFFLTAQANAIMYFARPYDPNLQRWLTRDPIGEQGGLNLYGYVDNNPINEVDPLGQAGEATAVAYPTLLMTPEQIAAANAAAARAAARAAIAAAAAATTSFCPKPNDPCSGLRNQLNDHIRKLTEYIADPVANDNKGLFDHPMVVSNPALRDRIIDGRIRSLQNQINNFRKLLEACEKSNGM